MIRSSLLDKLMKLAVLVIIIVELAAVQYFIPDFYQTLFRLTLDGNVEGLTEYISSFGYGAIAITIFMIVLTNMTGLPSIPFLTVNGVIFGLLPGIVISWIGEVLGNILGFVIMRTVLRDKARKLVERSHLTEKLDKYSTIKTIALARAIPYSPNLVITAVASMSRISFANHLIATIIGKVPSVIVEVWLGHDLLKFGQYGGRIIIWATLILTVYYAYRQYKKR